MDPINVILWQFLALLLLTAVICGLLVFVFDQRDDVRLHRDRAAEERDAHRKARAEMRGLYARSEQLGHALDESRRMYEALADEHAAQQQVIEAYIPDSPASLEDRS